MTDQPTGLLTISEAAKRLGVHQNTLRSWADKGLISHVKLPSGYRRFRPEDIDQLKAEMSIEGKDAA
jgi:putative resolvase